jgi:hypothetical protein
MFKLHQWAGILKACGIDKNLIMSHYNRLVDGLLENLRKRLVAYSAIDLAISRAITSDYIWQEGIEITEGSITDSLELQDVEDLGRQHKDSTEKKSTPEPKPDSS